MDLAKPGPMYEAMRKFKEDIDSRRDDHNRRLIAHFHRIEDHDTDLKVLAGRIEALGAKSCKAIASIKARLDGHDADLRRLAARLDALEKPRPVKACRCKKAKSESGHRPAETPAIPASMVGPQIIPVKPKKIPTKAKAPAEPKGA